VAIAPARSDLSAGEVCTSCSSASSAQENTEAVAREVKRRTKAIGRFPGETSCLTLVWAVLDLFFSHASNGATFTDVDRHHL
jgi:hypothetical protein